MSKFVPVFRELATFTEVLHTQIELILVERLHHNWLKVMLPYFVILRSCCFKQFGDHNECEICRRRRIVTDLC